MKTPTTLAGPDDAVLLPTGATDADYEGELAIVIGRRALEDALAHVGGYTILNDVSDRAWQRRQSQWALGKCSDGSHRSARGSPRPTPPPTRGRARRGRPRRCRHGVAVDVAGAALAGGYLAPRLSGAPFAARVKSGHDRAGLTLATTADFPSPAAAGATVGGPTVPAPTES